MARIFVAQIVGKDAEKKTAEFLDEMSKATRSWEERAARGECPWICSDCGCSFNEGMPDSCVHGHQSCTDIITRDKAEALSRK